jgi:hypothetical protein
LALEKSIRFVKVINDTSGLGSKLHSPGDIFPLTVDLHALFVMWNTVVFGFSFMERRLGINHVVSSSDFLYCALRFELQVSKNW